MTAEMMNTHEVADYLRIKERKVYDLVRDGKIPCTRVTGKWLFPRGLIDQWVADHTEPGAAAGQHQPSPAVVAGSHDPLLDWALRESRCGLAALPGGSLDGLERLARREAALCGLHVFDGATASYNEPIVRRALADQDVVLLHWAWRRQGLVVAPGNPLGLRAIADLASAPGAAPPRAAPPARRPRVMPRQPEAGSQLLLIHLLGEAGIALDALDLVGQPARSESDLALAVQDGKADVGLAIEAVAQGHRLDFVPLARERFDLVVRRVDYFEPPCQALFAFARSPALRQRAGELAGYDISDLGRVVWNAAAAPAPR